MTPDIHLDTETSRLIKFAADISRLTPSEVVKRAIMRFVDEPSGQTNNSESNTPTKSDPKLNEPAHSGWVKVFAPYRHHRFEGEFELLSGRLRVFPPASSSARDWEKPFNSPSAAAMAVVRWVNPGRERAETNGWKFWLDAATRKPIGHAHRQNHSTTH